jgi:LysR family transcriptional regulator, transcriptional activator of the cysJI operon
MKVEARLRAFVGFVRRRSFAGAADELRISQPAVSKHIGDLERQLGTKLIERRSGGLTKAGEFLADHVLRAEAILAQAAHGIGAFREPWLGTLSIWAASIAGTYLVPEVIAKFQQMHPGVTLNFRLGTSAEVVNAVRSDRAELGIVGGFFAAAPEIAVEPFLDDEIVIVGSPKFKRRRLTRDDLESITWISREEGSATRARADGALAELGIVPKQRLELASYESIKLAVRRGYGIAAFSRIAMEEELKAGTLVVIPFAAWKVRRKISIIRIRDAGLTPAAQRFLRMLRARWCH